MSSDTSGSWACGAIGINGNDWEGLALIQTSLLPPYKIEKRHLGMLKPPRCEPRKITMPSEQL
jgi:hypothetical protein